VLGLGDGKMGKEAELGLGREGEKKMIRDQVNSCFITHLGLGFGLTLYYFADWMKMNCTVVIFP